MSADFKPGSSPAAAPPQAEFSFCRALARHWRSSVRYYGLGHTLAQLSGAAGRFLRELLPDRGKIKYGDLDYDFEHSVDTTRANAGFRAQLMAALTGHPYFPSEPWLFEEMMHALPVRFQDFTFVDLGSGKGRALLMAAPYGFKRIIGVEFMPEWHRAAEENIRKYAGSRTEIDPDELCGTATLLPTRAQSRRAHGTLAVSDRNLANEGTDKSVCATKATSIESRCLDARDFQFPAGPLVVYLFNPFPEPVLAAVLERLRQSLLTRPRPAFLVYRYPEFEDLLRKGGWLKKVAGTEQWTMYGH